MQENKIKNRIKFKIKTRYYLELLITETMKLLRSTKSKIGSDKNGENMLHIEIKYKVVLPHCNIVNNNYQHGLKIFYAFFPNKSIRQSLDISPKMLHF